MRRATTRILLACRAGWHLLCSGRVLRQRPPQPAKRRSGRSLFCHLRWAGPCRPSWSHDWLPTFGIVEARCRARRREAMEMESRVNRDRGLREVVRKTPSGPSPALWELVHFMEQREEQCYLNWMSCSPPVLLTPTRQGLQKAGRGITRERAPERDAGCGWRGLRRGRRGAGVVVPNSQSQRAGGPAVAWRAMMTGTSVGRRWISTSCSRRCYWQADRHRLATQRAQCLSGSERSACCTVLYCRGERRRKTRWRMRTATASLTQLALCLAASPPTQDWLSIPAKLPSTRPAATRTAATRVCRPRIPGVNILQRSAPALVRGPLHSVA